MEDVKFHSTEILFTPDWHWWFSAIMGDLKGQLGYITEYGTVKLLSKKDPEVSKFALEGEHSVPAKTMTAKKGGLL